MINPDNHIRFTDATITNLKSTIKRLEEKFILFEKKKQFCKEYAEQKAKFDNQITSENMLKYNKCTNQLKQNNQSQKEKIQTQILDNQTMVKLLKKIKQNNNLTNIFADIWELDSIYKFIERHHNLEKEYKSLAKALYDMDIETREYLFFSKEF